eukprot:5855438-Amphidinium_carterae.1
METFRFGDLCEVSGAAELGMHAHLCEGGPCKRPEDSLHSYGLAAIVAAVINCEVQHSKSSILPDLTNDRPYIHTV